MEELGLRRASFIVAAARKEVAVFSDIILPSQRFNGIEGIREFTQVRP